jgi:histidinol-phosphatase (PHP family)
MILLIYLLKGKFNMMLKCDMHTHSENSFDGKYSVIDMCKSAITKGLYAIAITDHADLNVFDNEIYDYLISEDILLEKINKSYNDTINAASLLENENFKILKGIEIGQANQNKELAKKLISMFEFDFIIGSLHNLYKNTDFYCIDYSKNDVINLLNKYAIELLEMINITDFDSLGHLTYPFRYMKDFIKNDNIFDDSAQEALKALSYKGCALEINTSGLSNKSGDTIPPKKYIKRFKELGGEYITIGSDAHKTDAVGSNFDDAVKIAYECKFKYITLYKNRKPISIEIK